MYIDLSKSFNYKEMLNYLTNASKGWSKKGDDSESQNASKRHARPAVPFSKIFACEA